ncbi:MAG: hypothetical protein WDN31_07660 [Hyphomicrobium sp.]
MAPKIAFPVSDVRDVAVTHALAMTTPEAAGQRFITANGFIRLIELGRLVAKALPDLAKKVRAPSCRTLPFASCPSSTRGSRRCCLISASAAGNQCQGSQNPRPDVPLAAGGGDVGGGEPARPADHLRALQGPHFALAGAQGAASSRQRHDARRYDICPCGPEFLA